MKRMGLVTSRNPKVSINVAKRETVAAVYKMFSIGWCGLGISRAEGGA